MQSKVLFSLRFMRNIGRVFILFDLLQKRPSRESEPASPLVLLLLPPPKGMTLSFHPDEVSPIDDTPFVNLPYNRYELKYEIQLTASFLGGRLVNLFPTITTDQGCLTAKENQSEACSLSQSPKQRPHCI